MTQPNPEQVSRLPTIVYKRFDTIAQKIERCKKISSILGEPRCMALEGVMGAGKTTLARYYVSQFPQNWKDSGLERVMHFRDKKQAFGQSDAA